MGKNKIKTIEIIILLITIIISISIIAHKNISNPNFWFDESGQFWMAKGLNHFSVPLSEDGNFYDVIKQNRSFNSDPGGFTTILHFWTKIANNPIWLRFLPFLFFIISVLFYALLIKRISGKFSIALISIVFIFLPKIIIHNAFELRAYGMEICGILVSLYFLLEAIKKPTKKKLLILGIINLIFMTSRYSFIINTSAITILIYVFVYNYSIKNFIVNGYNYYLPIIIGALLIYFFTFRHQIQFDTPPHYVLRLMLYDKDISEILNILKSNFLSRPALPVTLFLLIVPALTLFRKKYDDVNKLDLKFINVIYIWIISIEIISIILSLFGKYPWHISGRWNINLHVCSVLSLGALFIIIIQPTYDFINQLRYSNIFKSIIYILFVFAIITLSMKQAYKAKDSFYSYWTNLDNRNIESYQYYVGYKASSTIRYLFEYGPLKNKKNIYPENFTFETKHAFDKNVKINTDNYDVLLCSPMGNKRFEEFLGRINRNNFKDITGNLYSIILIDKNNL